MNPPNTPKKKQNVGGQVIDGLSERLSFEFIENKYGVSKEELLKLIHSIKDKHAVDESIPISILKSQTLSSLESIVKFLRENRDLSYSIIGVSLKRNPKTLAVSYAVAHRKMPEPFSKGLDDDVNRIPFAAFSENLSILECICVYLKSRGSSYAEIARLLDKDQRTVWTVCKRAEQKLGSKNVEYKKITDGRKHN